MKFLKEYFSHLKTVWSKKSEGFGDTFQKIAKTFGIKTCSKCEKRRKAWNERLSYAKKVKEIGNED